MERYSGPRSLLPDSTDIELATDADLNTLWRNNCDKPSPSQNFTVEQVAYSSQQAEAESNAPPPSRN